MSTPTSDNKSPMKVSPIVLVVVALVAVAGVVALFVCSGASATDVVEPANVPDTPAPAVKAPDSAEKAPAPAESADAPGAVVPKAGDVFEGRVAGLGKKGDGRIPLLGRTVYVAGVQAGETVRFRITRDGGKSYEGEKVDASTPLTYPNLKTDAKPEKEAAAPAANAPAAAADAVVPQVGDVFEGRVAGLGSRGDGRLSLLGRTVYIPDAKQGETVRFRIVRDNGKILIAEKVAADTPLSHPELKAADDAKKAAEVAAVSTSVPAPAGSLAEGVLDAATTKRDAVQVGAKISAVVSGKDKFNDKNAFCRIDGLAVVVENCAPSNERIVIEIVDRKDNKATAKPVK